MCLLFAGSKFTLLLDAFMLLLLLHISRSVIDNIDKNYHSDDLHVLIMQEMCCVLRNEAHHNAL